MERPVIQHLNSNDLIYQSNSVSDQLNVIPDLNPDQNHDFWFNDLLFTVPPEKIFVNEENAFSQTASLRQNGTDKVPVGISSQVFTIALSIPYKGAILNIDERDFPGETNTGKRGGILDLIIQSKHIHFAKIENAYLRSKLRIPSTHNMVFCVHQLALSTSPHEPENIVGTLTISLFNYTPFSDRYLYKKEWRANVGDPQKGTSLEDINPISLEGRIPYSASPPIWPEQSILMPENTLVQVNPKYLEIDDINNLDREHMEIPAPTRFPYESNPFKFYVDYLHSYYLNKPVSNTETFDCTQINPYAINKQNIGDTLVFTWKEFKSIPLPNNILDRIKVNVKKNLIRFRQNAMREDGENTSDPSSTQLSSISSSLNEEGKIKFFRDGHKRTTEFGRVRETKKRSEIDADGNQGEGYRFHKGIDIYPHNENLDNIVYSPWKMKVLVDSRHRDTLPEGGHFLRAEILEGELKGLIAVFFHLPYPTEEYPILRNIIDANTPLFIVGKNAGNTGIKNSDAHLHFELAKKDDQGNFVESTNYDKNPIMYRIDPGPLVENGRQGNIVAINNYYTSFSLNTTYAISNTLQRNISTDEKEIAQTLNRATAALPGSTGNPSLLQEYNAIIQKMEEDGWFLYRKDLTTLDLFYKEHKLVLSCNSSVIRYDNEPIVVESISGSTSNLFKKIPLSGIVIPTAQYLGQDDDTFLISLKSIGLNTVKKIEAIKEQIKIQAIRYKYIPEAYVVKIENKFINAFGNIYFNIIGTDSATVEGSPDTYVTEMRLVSHNLVIPNNKIKRLNKISDPLVRKTFYEEFENFRSKDAPLNEAISSGNKFILRQMLGIWNLSNNLHKFRLKIEEVMSNKSSLVPTREELSLFYRYNSSLELIANDTILKNRTDINDKLVIDKNGKIDGEKDEIEEAINSYTDMIDAARTAGGGRIRPTDQKHYGPKEYDLPTLDIPLFWKNEDFQKVFDGPMNLILTGDGRNLESNTLYNEANRKWTEDLSMTVFPPFVRTPRLVMMYLDYLSSTEEGKAFFPEIAKYPFVPMGNKVRTGKDPLKVEEKEITAQYRGLAAYIYNLELYYWSYLLGNIDNINLVSSAIDSNGILIFPKTRDLFLNAEKRSASPTYEDLKLPLHPLYAKINNLTPETQIDPDFYLLNPGTDTETELRSDFIINPDGHPELRNQNPNDLYDKYVDITKNYAIADFEGFCQDGTEIDSKGNVIPKAKILNTKKEDTYLKMDNRHSFWSEAHAATPKEINSNFSDWSDIKTTLGDNTSLIGTMIDLNLDKRFQSLAISQSTLTTYNKNKAETELSLLRKSFNSTLDYNLNPALESEGSGGIGFPVSPEQDQNTFVKTNITYNPESPNALISAASPYMQSEQGQAYSASKIIEALGSINKKKLAMRRAYPTCKIFFIEEDDIYDSRYVALDEYYTYSKIQSIEITESRKRPAAVCRITFSDPSGLLSGFNQWTKALDPSLRTPVMMDRASSIDETPLALDTSNPFLKGSINEQSDNSFVLSAGMKIKVKLGYSNDPYKLPDVFLGEISTVDFSGDGSTITVEALSYGAELVAKTYGISEDEIKEDYESTFILLAKIMFNPEIIHFGRRKIGTFSAFTEDQSIDKAYQNWKEGINSGFIEDWARRPGGSISESILFFDYIGSSLVDLTAEFFVSLSPHEQSEKTKISPQIGPQDDNLYPPTFTSLNVKRWYHYNTKFGGTQNEDGSLVEIDITDSKGEEKSLWIDGFTAAELSYNIFHSTIWDIFEEMTLRHPGYVKHPRIYEGADRFTMFFGLPDRGYWAVSGDPYITNQANSIFLAILKEQNVWGFGINPFNNYRDTDQYLAQSGGDDTSSVALAAGLQETRIPVNQDLLARFKNLVKKRFKPFRKYHHLNSFTDIISNDIEATSDGWATEVSIRYGSPEGVLLDGTAHDLAEKAGGIDINFNLDQERIVTCKANINLSVSNIRNSSFEFINAKSAGLAKRYARSILAKEAKDMYKGSLTLIGNQYIRPYDICVIHDTYTNTYGPIEVEEVIHHFSPETGFITTLIPDTLVVQEDSTPYIVMQGITPTIMLRTEKYMINSWSMLPVHGDIHDMPGRSVFNTYAKIAQAINANDELNRMELRNISNLINGQDDSFHDAAARIFTDGATGLGIYVIGGALGGVSISIPASSPVLAGTALISIPTSSTVLGGAVAGAGAAMAGVLVPMALIAGLGYFYMQSKMTNMILQYMGEQRAYFMLPLVRDGIPFVAGIDFGYDNSFYKGPLEQIRSYLNDGTAGLALQQSDLLANQAYQNQLLGESIGFWSRTFQDLERLSFQWDAAYNSLSTSMLGIVTE